MTIYQMIPGLVLLFVGTVLSLRFAATDRGDKRKRKLLLIATLCASLSGLGYLAVVAYLT